jgi:DNA polymerase V
MEVFLRTNRFRPADPQHSPGLAVTLDHPTHSTAELMVVARDLLGRIHRPGYRYKKTGIQLAGLVGEEEYQPGLFDRPKARIDVDLIVDEINRRLGDPKAPVITRASQGTIRSAKGWRMRSGRCSPAYTTDWNGLPEAKA